MITLYTKEEVDAMIGELTERVEQLEIPAPPPVVADPNESLLMFSGSRPLTVKFFGISAWDTPFKVNNQGAAAGSYGINRYCAYHASEPNSCTELTYLAADASKYANFDKWVEYHRLRGADVMVQVYIRGPWGAREVLTAAEWDYVVNKYQEFLARAAGRVKYVLLANEPLFRGAPGDNPNEATSPGWPSRSATLYAQYARVIKQLTPQGMYVIGTEMMSADSFRTSASMFAMNTSAEGPDVGYGNGAGTTLKDWIDIFSFHGYHWTSGTFAPVDGGYSLVKTLLSELIKIGFTKPVWQTEFMRTYSGMYNDSWNVIVEQIARRHAAEIALGIGHSCNFEWGSYGPNSFFDNPDARGERARNWWTAYTAWYLASPIVRVALLKDNKMKVTRADGKSLLIPDNLTDGTLAPNP